MTIRARELQADRVGDLEGEVDDRRVGLGGEEALADADGELDLGTRLPAGRVGGEVGGAMGVEVADGAEGGRERRRRSRTRTHLGT